MNKEELNRQVELLKTSLEAHEEQVKALNHDLKIAIQRLVDCDKLTGTFTTGILCLIKI